MVCHSRQPSENGDINKIRLLHNGKAQDRAAKLTRGTVDVSFREAVRKEVVMDSDI